MHAEETVEKLKQLNNQLTTSLEKFSRSTLNVESSSPPTSTLEEPTPATLAKSSSIETSPLGVNPEQLSKLVGSVSHNTEALIGQTTELSKQLGVTENAVRAFLKIMNEQQVPPEQLFAALAPE
jgi:peptidoglycan hydrolase-like protein with peptidoglycan-binding domain